MQTGGWGAQGSLEAEHPHHAVNNVVRQLQVAISVGDRTVFQKALWGTTVSRRVAARGWGMLWGWGRGRRCWGWGKGRRCWGWNRRGCREVRWRRRRKGERRRRARGRWGLFGGHRRRRRRRRGRGLGGHRRRCGARAWARPLSDEVRQRRQREVGRVVVVVSLDRAKVSSSTFGEPP